MNRIKLLTSALLAGAMLIVGLLVLLAGSVGVAKAAVYGEETPTTYKEYWVSHDEFPGLCSQDGRPRGTWYAEPAGSSICYLSLDIPDDFSSAIKAEIYLDLWRNRDFGQAQFRVNSGVTETTRFVGSDWSRTPLVREIPLADLVTGENIIALSTRRQAFHLHDMAIRIYYDDANPLVGTDTTAPDASLTNIIVNNQSFDPTTSHSLNIDTDQITLVATATTDAKFIEFHAFYDGYDVDNDGAFQDWHAIGRNNWHPGGSGPEYNQNPNPDLGGTINHVGSVVVGSDPNASYSVTWDIPHLWAQSGVKFKVRVVDEAGNVRDAAGGVSAEMSLTRSSQVVAFRIADFEDAVLHHGGTGGHPDEITRTINIPVDPVDFDTAFILGMYYNRPRVSLNNSSTFPVFGSGQDNWELGIRQFGVGLLQQGDNSIRYEHFGNSWGEFIEEPGPMIVLRQEPDPTAVSLLRTTATTSPLPNLLLSLTVGLLLLTAVLWKRHR